MEDAKALLDSLMGISRDKQAKDRRTDEWKEETICKRFLVGFCPVDYKTNWFHNTKRDVELCFKFHSERTKQDFEAHPDRSKYEGEYQAEFLRYLETLTVQADAHGVREKSHCAVGGGAKVCRLTEGQKQCVARMQEAAQSHLAKAEELADKGQLTASRAEAEKQKELMQDIEEIKEGASFVPKGDLVCTICGVRFNEEDDDAHKNSNLHSAYVKIRDMIKELREKLKDAPLASRGDGRDRGDRGRDRGRRDGGLDGGRDRDRDRGERDRGDRDRRRGGDRDRGRARERSRSR